MVEIILGFGSNQGDRQKNIIRAYDMVQQSIGSKIVASSFFETQPWGFDSENLFLNSVAVFSTQLSARQCLSKIHEIEFEMGRRRSNTQRYTDRCIDIDILFFGNEVVNQEDLIIPHPLLHQRDFVLEPLKEILPDFIHPVLNKKISEI